MQSRNSARIGGNIVISENLPPGSNGIGPPQPLNTGIPHIGLHKRVARNGSNPFGKKEDTSNEMSSMVTPNGLGTLWCCRRPADGKRQSPGLSHKMVLVLLAEKRRHLK